MTRLLRTLVVEDVEQDAELLLRTLRSGGFDVRHQRVDTPEAMRVALVDRTWDIVLSDYSMPQFSALKALELVRELRPELPFIVVSGTVNEDLAVEAIHAGAADFMAKGKFARLIPAIERELKAVALRTEQARMREQLVISDRLASVGSIAAGIAHEINNPLASLIANLDFVSQDVGVWVRELEAAKASGQGMDASECAKSLRRFAALDDPLSDARKAAQRVWDIVRDVKAFSRSEEIATTAVDVRAVLDSALRMCRSEIQLRALLVVQHGMVSAVEANEGRLCQVFLNLLVNALQAIPEGDPDHNEVRIVSFDDGAGHVVVEIHDTGIGMTEAVLGRIFDPFFTTKPVGVGTGLGLAICHRIVTDLGGTIGVESRSGQGTVVRTMLRVAESVVTEAPPQPVRRPAARRGRVLVIDDDLLLGTAVRRTLVPEHEVVVESSARVAIDRICGGDLFDVILCDLMMPEVTGMDLYDELTRCRPAEAETVVFMTGGTFTQRARDFLAQVPNARIEKPFDVTALRALIRSRIAAR